MDIQTLTGLLETALGQDVPVFFHHLFVEQGEEMPADYVVTDTIGINAFRADNKNYYTTFINTVTVYGASYNEALLASVEGVMDAAGVPYDRATDYDPDTLMFSTVYTLELDEAQEAAT